MSLLWCMCLLTFLPDVTEQMNVSVAPGAYGTTVQVVGVTFAAKYVRIFCENPVVKPANLTCGPYHTLDIVYANYGRTRMTDCPAPRGAYETTDCDSISSYYTLHVRQECEGKQTCAYNFPQPQFGNPCKGIWRYLEVHFDCIKCSLVTWGTLCEKKCYCKQGRCDPTTGLCLNNECGAGWNGTHCDIPCENGWHGEGCTGLCTEFCANCDRFIGCTKCVSGKTNLPDCSSHCPPGTYGLGCRNCGNCTVLEACHVIEGYCMKGCIPGYKGRMCNITCAHGEFGKDCQYPCGNCKYGDACNPVSGKCPRGCSFGSIGRSCGLVLWLSLIYMSMSFAWAMGFYFSCKAFAACRETSASWHEYKIHLKKDKDLNARLDWLERRMLNKQGQLYASRRQRRGARTFEMLELAW